jgi:hypothetical protein
MIGLADDGAPRACRRRQKNASGRLRRQAALLLAVGLLIAAGAGRSPASAAAAGNASAAAGFIENAQNSDGGFGAKRGQRSDPGASLWAATALLAAGKNPADEWVKGGASLDEYLAAHARSYTSLSDLGLLALVQSAATGSSGYGDPVAKLEGRLSAATAHSDPAGSALGVLGLLAANTAAARQTAASVAQALLGSATSDGGWGEQGLSDSASTALVLQALAASGVADLHTPAVQTGLSYLHRAQANDGSIAASIRTDQAIASGSVTATAFTIQALIALGAPPLRTPTGTTVLQGLTQYQQQSSGGLSADGSLYSQIPPSVEETAQAFPAFDGVTFPLAAVARATNGPPARTHGPAHSNHVSSGTAAQGLSGASSTAADKGAFKQATATGHKGQKGASKHAGAAKPGAKRAESATPGGTAVSGEVVGPASPKLTAVAGQSPPALSAKAKATIALAVLLLACLVAGGLADARRPRADGRSLAAVTVSASARFIAAARARGSFVPFAVALLGLGLILIPVTTRMFERAPQGAKMITAFKPHMQAATLNAYELDVRQLGEGFRQAGARGPALLAPRLGAAQARARFAADVPQASQFEQEWPQVERRLTKLLATIRANRSNYEAVAALPSFRSFPWFFVIPGAILILLAGAALVAARAWRRLRWIVLAVAISLIAAPLAFGMWSRAPRGETLVRAFASVETRSLVTQIQNDFGTITTGEGSLGGELVPALEARGLDTARIDAAMPAVAKLEGDWIGILQNLTPLIGVMSDNVANYQAVAALPAFGLFPWLFLIPGLLVACLVLLGASGARLPMRRRVRAVEPQTTPHPQGAQ